MSSKSKTPCRPEGQQGTETMPLFDRRKGGHTGRTRRNTAPSAKASAEIEPIAISLPPTVSGFL